MAPLIDRLLSLINTNPYSKTYGSFDRDYWHYKTLRDFESATYQQGVLSLALLYKNQFDGNLLFKNQKVLDLIRAAIEHWRQLQNGDGSFNEWFPNEHSHVATAFITYAITESVLLLGGEIELNEPGIFKSIERAGDWLISNHDSLVTNHAAGAMVALYNIFLITGNKKYLTGAKKQLDIIIKNQSEEGWFLEYDGCDLGYLSVTVDFLAKYHEKSRDEKVLPVITKALDFMSHFIHPDGTYGGEYGSRNTKYLFTHGLVILSSFSSQARYIFNQYWVNFDSSVNLSSSDDRYFVFFFLPNYLQTLQALKNRGVDLKNEEIPPDFEENYLQAGIFVKRNKNFHLIVNYKKGGVLKLFAAKDKKLVYADSGHLLKTSSGILYSASFDKKNRFEIIKNERETNIFLSQRFSFLIDTYPLSKLLIPFRIFNYVFGRSQYLMCRFNKIIKKFLILRAKPVDIFLERSISVAEEKIAIKDEIVNNSGLKILSREKVNNFSARHVPSSRFFRMNDFLFMPSNEDEICVDFQNYDQ